MYLAINYSAPARLLVQSGQIEIEYFKTPDWDWMVKEAKELLPVAVHFTLEAGNDNLSRVDWSEVERISQTTGTPYINLHLDSRQIHFPDVEVDTTRASDVERVLNLLISNVMNVVERFGAERIIVENSPFRRELGNTLRPCVEPEVIRRVVEETGCGFLLDISHAIIAATTMGMKPNEYFSQLPLHKVKEMHFAGIHHLNDQWIDHLSILKKDWQWLDWVLTHIRSGECSLPWLLAFEYGGVGAEFEWRTDPKVIVEQVPQLYERVKALGNTL